jgi:hypothetical protein
MKKKICEIFPKDLRMVCGSAGRPGWPEPVFLNVYGAQESIPRNRFCQPELQIGLSYRPARLGIDSWAPEKVYKYGLC